MDLQTCMEQRRSVRKYTNKPVPRELIREMIQAAILWLLRGKTLKFRAITWRRATPKKSLHNALRILTSGMCKTRRC